MCPSPSPSPSPLPLALALALAQPHPTLWPTAILTSSYTGFFCTSALSYLIRPHLAASYPVSPLSTPSYVVSCNWLHSFCNWLAPSCNWLLSFCNWLAPSCNWLHSSCNWLAPSRNWLPLLLYLVSSLL